jgi:hypothetical protein
MCKAPITKTFLLIALLFSVAPPAHAQLKITGETRCKIHRFVKLQAEGAPAGAALLWRWDKKKLDGGKNGDGLWLVGPPGEYVVELIALRLDKEGKTTIDEASTTITIEGDAPPAPPPAAVPPKPTPKAALGRLRVGNSGCTATVIGPRRSDRRWDVLSANHCLPRGYTKGTLTMPDGRTLALTLSTREAKSDLAWFVTDEKHDSLPFAMLATKAPVVGTAIWHAGFGVDKPGNVETGKVLAGEDASRQISMYLNVSHGDSGGGIFREDTGELIAVVCCTRGVGRLTQMFGGSSVRAIELRPGHSSAPCEHPVLDLARFDWAGQEKK